MRVQNQVERYVVKLISLLIALLLVGLLVAGAYWVLTQAVTVSVAL